MKITLETPSRMILKDNNFSGFIFGLLFSIVGFVVAFLTATTYPSNAALGIIFGAMFTIVGIYIILTNKATMVILDKATGKGSITLKGIIGSQSRDILLKDVKRLILRKNYNRNSSRSGVTTGDYEFSLGFVLDTNEELQFKIGNTSSSIGDAITSPDDKQKRYCQQVADFLGVKMEYYAPPPITDILKAVKEGIAEGMERSSKGDKL